MQIEQVGIGRGYAALQVEISQLKDRERFFFLIIFFMLLYIIAIFKML